MKIDLNEIKVNNEDNEEENKKDFDIYNLKIYIVLEFLAEEENQKEDFQNF